MSFRKGTVTVNDVEPVWVVMSRDWPTFAPAVHQTVPESMSAAPTSASVTIVPPVSREVFESSVSAVPSVAPPDSSALTMRSGRTLTVTSPSASPCVVE